MSQLILLLSRLVKRDIKKNSPKITENAKRRKPSLLYFLKLFDYVFQLFAYHIQLFLYELASLVRTLILTSKLYHSAIAKK